jgi:biotin carboxyl carrier protein
MHGTVIAVPKNPGEDVAVGETVAVIEAMKMENEIPAHRSGTVVAVSVKPGDSVEAGQPLATIE